MGKNGIAIMNGLIEKVIVPGGLLLAYLGSLQWQIRNKVSKDRFGDLIARLDRIENKIDEHNNKEA